MSILIYGLNLLVLAGLIWWLWKQNWNAKLRPYFFPTLLLKLACGLLIGVLSFYVFYKGGHAALLQAGPPDDRPGPRARYRHLPALSSL
ncbi:hypothetical protein [Pontibacter virosus]|uniref:Uncharacterized protein n=1 Tax=Pontibacter virosus TaxID=1765052 RepID=A0A2U1AZ97_9BACT|nr:hypothetical protein [Pontibacter virosus]PVY41733.1 hypothetical protein C8E01_104104 [Pontibacter virosus]